MPSRRQLANAIRALSMDAVQKDHCSAIWVSEKYKRMTGKILYF